MIRSKCIAQLLDPGQCFGEFSTQFLNLGVIVPPHRTRPRSDQSPKHPSYLDARAARTIMSHAWSVLNPSPPRGFAGLKSDGLRTRINSPVGVSGIGSAKTGFNNPASITARHLSYTFISSCVFNPGNAILLSFYPSLIPGLVARAIVSAVCLVIPIPRPLQIGGAGAAHSVFLAVGLADVQARVDLVLRMASFA